MVSAGSTQPPNVTGLAAGGASGTVAVRRSIYPGDNQWLGTTVGTPYPAPNLVIGSANVYDGRIYNLAPSSQTGTGPITYYVPFFAPSAVTVKLMQLTVTTVTTSGNQIFGLCSMRSDGYPGTLVASSSATTVATGVNTSAAVSWAMAAGWNYLTYTIVSGSWSWIAGTGTAPRPFSFLPQLNNGPVPGIPISTNNFEGFTAAAAAPSSNPTVNAVSGIPLVGIRV